MNNMNITYIAARYDSARNICATVEDEDGQLHDAWFMASGGQVAPPDVVAMADADEAA